MQFYLTTYGRETQDAPDAFSLTLTKRVARDIDAARGATIMMRAAAKVARC